MARNYDRSFEKENSYEIDSFVLSKGKHSTNAQLRKKLEQNLVLIEKGDTNIGQRIEALKPGDSSCLPASTKRENPRRRGFDLKISNIDTINEKITGLLNIVKKDRQQNELKETLKQEKNITESEKEANHSPNYKITNRWKKFNDSNSKIESNLPRQDMMIQKFNERMQDRRRPLNYEEIKNRVGKIQDQQTLRSQNIRALRMRYLQQNTKRQRSSNSKITQMVNARDKKVEQVIGWWDQVLEEERKQKYTFGGKSRNNNQEQMSNIDQMIEKRRKERLQMREGLRNTSEDKVITKSRSAIKSKIDYQFKEKLINDSKRDSPITKVNEFDPKMDDHFIHIRTPHSRKNSRDPQSNFSEMTYVEEQNGKEEKINCTAKLIDEQLMRIKSKINDSELNKKKIESFKSKTHDNYKGKEHTMRIAQQISKQIKFDSHLKEAREAFDKIPGESKWIQLNRAAEEKGLAMDNNILKELVSIGPDQHNPFGVQKTTISIVELITLLQAAQRNWENCVLKCASLRSLKNQGFQVSDLDLSNKGYLSAEDIVCFVNLYVNSFYRNRDFALVIRRLQLFQGDSQKRISFDTFLEAFSV